jgi:hypothetical protein
LNAEDLAGMHAFAFKIEQELGRQVSLWGQIRMNLDKYCAAQEIIIEAFKKKEND